MDSPAGAEWFPYAIIISSETYFHPDKKEIKELSWFRYIKFAI